MSSSKSNNMATNEMATNEMATNNMATKEWINSLFNPINNRTDKIMAKIKAADLQYILNGLCYLKDDAIVIDFKYFKFFAEKATHQLITQVLINHCDLVLQNYSRFVVHLNVSALNIAQLDKHRTYLTQLSQLFATKYPDTLKTCYVYNASFVFSQIFNIVSMFVDKDTLKKIQIIPPFSG
jgi:hypothetical protein